MINKTKDILKRKYVVPTILTERMEPWEMIAQTQTDVGGGNMGTEGDNSGFSAKYNPFFSPYSDDDDYTEE